MPKITGVQFDGKALLETIRDYGEGKRRAHATALGFQMEDTVGEIKETTAGPHTWDTNTNWNLLKQRGGIGFGSEIANRRVASRFAQAINIAKSEGHVNFSRAVFKTIKTRALGVQESLIFGASTKYTREKNVRVMVQGASAGWKRVMELFPRMTSGQRPPLPQVLWIQTAIGRASIDWGMKSVDGNIEERGDTSVVGAVPPGSFVLAFIWVKEKYMREHEESGRYPFAMPVLTRRLNSGEFYRYVQEYVRQFTESFVSREKRKKGRK